MQPYQNYFQQNQNYQYQNPYSNYDRMNTMPNYQQQVFPIQQQTNQGIIGRLIDSDAEITVNDVPMNGQPAIFPSKDLSKIEIRQWDANGTINKIVYVPKIEVLDDKANNVSDMGFEGLNDRFNEFEKVFNDRFDKLEKAIVPKSTRTKKEVVADE